MLRRVVAELLRESPILTGTFVGGIYPMADSDPSVMGAQNYPDAFLNGEMLPTILVQDSTTTPFGPFRHSASSVIRVLYWQQNGRTAIDAGIQATIAKLNGASRSPSGVYVYRFDFAGIGPSVRDPELGDAEHCYTTWQAPVLIGKVE